MSVDAAFFGNVPRNSSICGGQAVKIVASGVPKAERGYGMLKIPVGTGIGAI